MQGQRIELMNIALFYIVVIIIYYKFISINLSLFCISEIKIGLVVFFALGLTRHRWTLTWSLWKTIHFQAPSVCCQNSLPYILGLKSLFPY